MTCTRPDICSIVTILSQYMSKPTMAHLNMAKYVLRFLKGTIDFGLSFLPFRSLSIIGHTMILMLVGQTQPI